MDRSIKPGLLSHCSILARHAGQFSLFLQTWLQKCQAKCLVPDTLSLEDITSSDTILPPSCVVAAISLGIKAAAREAQRNQPDPGNSPANRLFVPESVCSQVLQSVHTSRFSCHPGFNHTLSLLKRCFWWATMEADTQAYVSACTVCAQSKASHRTPEGQPDPTARAWPPMVTHSFQLHCGVTAVQR